MAGHDDELQRLSRFSDFFDDTESRFKDGKLSIAKSLLEGASDVTEFLEAVEDEMQNIYRQQERLSSAGALYESILEDQAAQIAKQAEKERKRAKDRMKIELEIKKIEKDRADLSDKEQKAADKKLKILQKQLTATERIQKAEKAVEAATSAAKDTYGSKLEQRKNLAEEVQEASKLGVDLIKDGFKSLDFGEIFSGMKLALTGGLTGGAGFVKALDNVVSAIGNLSKKLDKTIEEIVAYKSDWDTRLFGSDKSYSSVVDAISKSVGASPFVKESDVMKKLNEAIDKGIAYNVEQRAFLQTIKDDIATTFDAFDSTLLQIVRVQQSDSTAARLGMETALNQYLNSMFSTTEYLTNVSDSVTNAIYEATSLLSSQQSIGFEYQVQKWLGSLYSVGMSQSAITSIADSLGKLASGDISSTTSGTGKLLVMAASQAGLSYADLMTKGINDSDLNTLMESMVNYLQQIANSNKVVQTQYAQVYGLKTSDIVAATNLQTSIQNISQYGLDYAGAVGTLNEMARTIGERLSLGEMLENVTNNFQYRIAAGIADNPGMYALWAISGLLDEYMGGIAIPAVSVFGNMVDLHTTVADLMRVTAMSASLLGGIGEIVSSVGEGMSGQGLTGVLSRLGVSGQSSAITRGTGLIAPSSSSVTTTSVTSYIGNVSGSDIYESTMASVEDQKKEIQLSASAEDEESANLNTIQSSIGQIIELLKGTLTVRFSDNVAVPDSWS